MKWWFFMSTPYMQCMDGAENFLPVDWALAGNCRTANLHGALPRALAELKWRWLKTHGICSAQNSRSLWMLSLKDWRHRRATHTTVIGKNSLYNTSKDWIGFSWPACALHLFFTTRNPSTGFYILMGKQIYNWGMSTDWRLRFLRGGISLSSTTTTCHVKSFGCAEGGCKENVLSRFPKWWVTETNGGQIMFSKSRIQFQFPNIPPGTFDV